jgi:hypothetical protein
MATSSASVSACAPFDKILSRGRSSCGHDAMPSVFVLDADIQLVPPNTVTVFSYELRDQSGLVFYRSTFIALKFVVID